MRLYKVTIEIEQDDCGFHAVVIDAEDDSVLRVTITYARPEDAEQEAKEWIAQQEALTLGRINDAG